MLGLDMNALASSVIGNGPHTTVLLHGFLGSGRNLRTLAQRWSARDASRRFVLPDLLGHGESAALPIGATQDVLAQAVLDHLGAEARGPVSFVGHSLGGRIALAAVRVDPTRVRDVVLLDIAPGPLDPASAESGHVLEVLLRAPDHVADRREMRSFLVGQGLSESLTDWLLMNVRREGDGYSWRFDRHALRDLHERFYRDDLWPVVESRRVRVRCFRGALSRYVTEDDAARLRGAGCEVATIARAGHFVHVEGLEEVLDLLSNHREI